MAYNPTSAINKIYQFKSAWNTANEAGDNTKKNDVAQKAQKYYDELKQNGYEDVANNLSTADLNKAQTIVNNFKTLGKTSTRDYLKTLGKKYDLSDNEINNLISWDSGTGEVSFGGTKIGRPDVVVDGVSYWNDTTALDNAFNDYIKRSGTTRSKSTAVNQENDNLFAKYNQEYEDLKNTNPFTTDEAKAILGKYDLAGLQERDNTVARNAGANGGNIDSYAAANAMRQQAALISQGQGVVLDAYRDKLEHARNLLSDMGVNIERVFNEDETANNNDVTRKSEVASVTGYTPTEWSVQNDAFLKNFVDENGKLKPQFENTDFQALANNAKASGNNDLANKYAILRGLKIFGNFEKYGQYLGSGDIAYIQPQKTEEARQFDEKIAAGDRQLQTEAAINDANNQAALDQMRTAAELQGNAGTGTNASGTYSDDNGTYLNGIRVGDKNGKPILSKKDAEDMYKKGNRSEQVIYALQTYGVLSGVSDDYSSPSTESVKKDNINSAVETAKSTAENVKDAVKELLSGTDSTATKNLSIVPDIVQKINSDTAIKNAGFKGDPIIMRNEKFTLNPDIPQTWKERIVKIVASDGRLSDTEARELLNSWGISDDVIATATKHGGGR